MNKLNVHAHIGGKIIVHVPDKGIGIGYCGECEGELKYLGLFIVGVAKARHYYQCMKCGKKFETKRKLNIRDKPIEEFVFR